MAQKDIYIEIATEATSKNPASVCGDITRCMRSSEGTLFVLCDGQGSGITANLAAEMAVSRLMELVNSGFSLQQAVEKVITTIAKARGKSPTYAAMTVIFIRPDGSANIYGYEAPPVLWISRNRSASIVHTRPWQIAGAIIQQSSCFLETGEALIACSDGITQAGLGRNFPDGFTPEEMAEICEIELRKNVDKANLAKVLHSAALTRWRQTSANDSGDDCTVSVISCRKAEQLNIFTGPPADRRDDVAACKEFLRQKGSHIVCGGTTANVLANFLGKELTCVAEDFQAANSLLTPPRFALEGIDLVAEGAVTLSQTLNLLNLYEQRSGATNVVSQLLDMIHTADHIRFFVGRAENASADDILMRQLGVRQRLSTVKKMAEELRRQQKLVTIKYY